ncbi:MAG TPA: efflux RND transporter permease subunit [Solirubrobacterales bacterium]|jgi:RND superfamily putative drug exporter|nr:efflux RND transporter permease subunit [Solirubrobacterales bacterium]
MFNALASLAQRRGKLVVLVAVVFFAIAGALGSSVADKLDPYGADDPDTESVIADERLEEAGFRDASVIVLVDAPVSEASGRERVREIERRVAADRDVAAVTGYLQTRSPDFVSEDGDRTYLAVSLTPTEDKEQQDAGARIVDELAGEPGVKVGGYAVATEQVNKQVEEDLQTAEMLAFPLLFLLSFVFFRSLVAALLPLMIGALAIVGTFLLLSIASELGSISIFALNLTTGLGLGLAIDYSLFVVSRYREEIAKTGPGLEAMKRTMMTAGRTVFFSSLTVAAALASLLVFPQRFLYSMGLGGALVALLAALISLTVLPAVLALLGERVNSLAPKFLQRRADRDARAEHQGFWYRLSRFVMRRPAPIAIASAAFLLALGIPALHLKFTAVDAQVLPQDQSARQVDDVMRSEFPPFRDSPVRVLVENSDSVDSPAATAVRNELQGIEGIVQVNPPRQLEGGNTVIEAVSDSPFIEERSRETVTDVRDLPNPPGSQLLVSGATASFVDFQDSLEEHLPIALAIIFVATLIVLFLMTGSVVLPIKQLLMNVLNLTAVFGILVFIFQDGRLEGLLDYTSQGALEQTMPILLFAVAFGLSTDYGVFLLSRIKEARDAGASDSECIAIGLERTGRIVTAAALLFAIAIGAFATSQIIFIKENGVGTALAVLLDASIIRALLVPSLMELLGRWNWWAPKPLRRLYARWGLSETAPETAAGRA